MTDESVTQTPLKRCSRKDKCVNPLGQYLPATHEFFAYENTELSILKCHCKVCGAKAARERGAKAEVKAMRKANRNLKAENQSRSTRRTTDPNYRQVQNESMANRRASLGGQWRNQDNEYKRTDRTNHPEKALAREAVNRAVKRGEMPPIKTLKCVLCGNSAKHYHHPDYSKPLEVIPLCNFCHGEAHRRNQ